MKSAFRSRVFDFSFEIPTGVYAVVGLTGVALVAILSFAHSPPQTVDATISHTGITLAVDTFASTRQKSPERNYKPQLENTPLMTPPVGMVAINSQIGIDLQALEETPTTRPKMVAGAHKTPVASSTDQVMAQGGPYEGALELERRPCRLGESVACYYP